MRGSGSVTRTGRSRSSVTVSPGRQLRANSTVDSCGRNRPAAVRSGERRRPTPARHTQRQCPRVIRRLDDVDGHTALPRIVGAHRTAGPTRPRSGPRCRPSRTGGSAPRVVAGRQVLLPRAQQTHQVRWAAGTGVPGGPFPAPVGIARRGRYGAAAGWCRRTGFRSGRSRTALRCIWPARWRRRSASHRSPAGAARRA